MDAGTLNRRIAIQTRTAGVDAAGQPTIGWSTTYTLWANVKGQTGLGAISGGDMQNDMAADVGAYSFRIRYNTNIKASMAILYNSVRYDIKAVRHDIAERDWTDLIAQAGGYDG